MSRTIDQIKQEIVNNILAIRSDIKIVEGDTQHDVVVQAPAFEFYKYEVLQDFETQTLNLDGFTQLINDETFKATFAGALGFKQDGTSFTVPDVNALISSRLDAYVSDWDISRNPGSLASGFVRVYLTDATAVSWNPALVFTSTTGTTYNPSASVSNVVPNFSASKGQYYVDIPVVAVTTGLASNAIAGAVRTLTPKFPTQAYCVNESPINGGLESETDLDLIDRARQTWGQRVNGSLPALIRLAGQQVYVSDVYAADTDDNINQIYLGSLCDLWTQFGSVDSELIEELIYWPGLSNNTQPEQFSFVLQNQPVVKDMLPVVFKYDTAGNETQIIPATNESISLVKDTGTFQGSVQAMDSLLLKIVLNTSTYQRRLKVLYLRDRNPYNLQGVFNDPNQRMIGPSPLIKNAIPVPLRTIAELKISFGFDAAQVQAAVILNLGIFFNGGTTTYGTQYARKGIGESISHSDVGLVILRTPGVVSYDTTTFRVINTLTGDVLDPTSINNSQYATLFDVLFQYSTINLSNFTASAV